MFFSSSSQFLQEEWLEEAAPTVDQLNTLLRKGASERQNFVAWFMEKVISNLSFIPNNL